MACFAALAVSLSLMGVYAVLASDVLRRRREIGIRFVLGARTRQVCSLVVASGLLTAVLGLAISSLGSLALARLLESFLFDVAALDPLTYAATAALVLLCSALASSLPAWRAAGIQPAESLRAE